MTIFDDRYAFTAETQDLHALLADLPPPEVVARYLSSDAMAALVCAQPDKKRGCTTCLTEAHAVTLRSRGLCEFGGRRLSVLGTQVRAHFVKLAGVQQ